MTTLSSAASTGAIATATRAVSVDTLVRCEHPGCPYAASKHVRIEQRLGEQRLRFCAAHAGVWAQRSAGRRGQTLTVTDYPCPADGEDHSR